MSSSDHRFDVIDHLYGELDGTRRRAFDRALESDADLEAEVRSLARVRALYSDDRLPEPGAALSEAILRQAPLLRETPDTAWGRFLRLILHPAVGATAVVAVTVSTGLYFTLRGGPAVVHSDVASAVETAFEQPRNEEKGVAVVETAAPDKRFAEMAAVDSMSPPQTAKPAPEPVFEPRYRGDVNRTTARKKALKSPVRGKADPLLYPDGVPDGIMSAPSPVSKSEQAKLAARYGEPPMENSGMSASDMEAEASDTRRSSALKPSGHDQAPRHPDRVRARKRPKAKAEPSDDEQKVDDVRRSQADRRPMSYFEAGLAAFDRRSYEDALDLFVSAERLDPSGKLAPGPKVMTGRSLMELERFTDAARLFEEVLALFPEYGGRPRVARDLVSCYQVLRAPEQVASARKRFALDLKRVELEAPAAPAEARE